MVIWNFIKKLLISLKEILKCYNLLRRLFIKSERGSKIYVLLC